MSCLWCLDHCVRVPADEEENAESKKEPLADLVEILEQIAWKILEKDDPPSALTFSERLCGMRKVLKPEVDTTFISVIHSDTLSLRPKQLSNKMAEAAKKREEGEGEAKPTGPGVPEVGVAPPNKTPKGTTFLFQSHYHNDTNQKQTYSFKTERQTKSSVEMSIQRGFTMGQSLELEVKIPTGIKGCKVSGKLGGQMQWSFTKGRVSRQEEQVTWSVDSHIQVEGNTTGIATLAVQEMRWEADFSLDCIIRPRPIECGDEDGMDDSDSDDAGPMSEPFPVFFRRRTTGKLIKVVLVPRGLIVEAWPSHFKKYDGDKTGIVCTLKGQCSSVCAINQRVWLEEAALAKGTGRPGILHQDSMIMGSDN